MSTQPGLADLPVEIQRIIIQHRIIARPLLVPRYYDRQKKGKSPAKLRAKCREYYGKRTRDQIDGAYALMNLSACSRYFRNLLVPEIFNAVVLRSKPKSIASIQAIQMTSIWSHVQQLLFAGTWKNPQVGKDPSKWAGATSRAKRASEMIDFEMQELTAILENLPPNLTTLLLDFPHAWTSGFGQALFKKEEWAFNDGYGGRDVNRYQDLIANVFGAIGKNDISSKAVFDLRILGLPPVDILVGDEYYNFLENVTSFTLGLCHYKTYDSKVEEFTYKANHSLVAQDWCSSINDLFLRWLEKATTLQIHADESWPLGRVPFQNWQCDLDLPLVSHIMPNLSTVSFKHVWICPELLDFLVLNKKTLTSIELIDCTAHADDYDADPKDLLSWGELFRTLATAKPQRLCHFIVANPSKTLEDLIILRDPEEETGLAKERDDVWSILDTQDEELSLITDKAELESAKLRQRKVLPYCNDFHGDRTDDQYDNMKRFLAQWDHECWLRIVSIMERNLAKSAQDLARPY